jgi:hypothetical protein
VLCGLLVDDETEELRKDKKRKEIVRSNVQKQDKRLEVPEERDAESVKGE